MAIDLKNYEPALTAGADITTTGALSVGSLTSGAQTVTGVTTSLAGYVAFGLTAVPASASAVATGKPITMFTSGPSIYVTSDVPAFTAVKGSVCINTGGTTTNNRVYINTDSGTTWTAITTAA